MMERIISQTEIENEISIDCEIIPLPFIWKRLAALTLVKDMCDRYGSHSDLRTPIASLHRSVLLERSKTRMETVDSYFEKLLIALFDKWDITFIGTNLALPDCLN